MYKASLADTTITISAPDVTTSITYPKAWMAVNAFSGIFECCSRFSKDPEFTPNKEPKIYVYGEMHTWQQYLKRLLLLAEKIGATIKLQSVKTEYD